jgi:ParB family chromosome partitioning protein
VGLALTPSSANEPVGGQGIVQISLREITVNLSNPRKSIDEAELDELAQSIRQHGVLQPILVRPLTPDERQRHKRTYQIVIGSRRFHAAERAGLATIDCYVRGFTPDEAVVASFLDHAHHRTLTAAEEAEFLRYLREQRKMRLREIAALINKSIAYVHRRLGVFEHPQLEAAIREGRLSQAAAQEIVRAPEAAWPVLIRHAPALSAGQVRALVNEVVAGALAPDAVEQLLARRAASAARGAGATAATTAGFDPALRQHGPVTHVPAAPAFALLRLVRAWHDGLPADWTPTPEELALLEQVRDLVAAVRERRGGDADARAG